MTPGGKLLDPRLHLSVIGEIGELGVMLGVWMVLWELVKSKGLLWLRLRCWDFWMQ